MHLGFSHSENACIVVLQFVTRLFLGRIFNINFSLQFYVERLHVKPLRVKVLIRGSQFQQLRIFTIHGNFGVNIAIFKCSGSGEESTMCEVYRRTDKMTEDK